MEFAQLHRGGESRAALTADTLWGPFRHTTWRHILEMPVFHLAILFF